MYGSSAPPPPPALNGSLPSRRIDTQQPPEMPSCVQNAMMTKDKKPFTYTPGGIDLSQIKSPRMAQRISRNANMEGVTNQPKQSPLAKPNVGAVPSPPPSTLGMPVQVFPHGPPPPPPAPKSAQLNANETRSPSMTRKSPQPQSFEPPPIGFRPEIKIPPNPMAALRKVPLPKPKEVDWNEEYRKERSKSPMPGAATNEATNNTDAYLPEPVRDFNQINKSSDRVDSPMSSVQASLPRQSSIKENESSSTDQNNNFPSNNYGGNLSSPQQRVFSPFSSSPQPNLPKPLSPVKLNQSNQGENVPIYVRNSQRAMSPKPPTYDQGQSSPVSNMQRQPSFEGNQTPVYARTSGVSAPQNNHSTFKSNDPQAEKYPIYVRSFQKQPAPAPPTTQQPFNKEPGKQYYQPPRVESPATNGKSAPMANQQMPPWMRRTNSKEIPEWANHADEFNQAPQNANQNQFTNESNYPANGAGNQYASNNFNGGIAKERVVPIQYEQSATKAAGSPGFTAQPYQNVAPQYNRVQPPPFAPAASNYASTYNDPHKFVDQGYNNVHNWDISQRVMSPTMKPSDGSRVVPIKLEDGHPYLNGPVSQTPHVIQSESRSAPNQSKSFRVLQQITDTMKLDSEDRNAMSKPAELHQPHYSRPLGPNDMNEHQLRKMKLNEDASKNQPFEARFQQQFPDWVPSKPFSVLHSVMRPDNDGPGYTDL